MPQTFACKICAKSFEITAWDEKLYEKNKMPFSLLCPLCRRKRRLASWPFGHLQKRKCDFSRETIISTFSQNCRFPIYKRDYWFSDKWTPPEQTIDWNHSFIDQLYELQSKTPHFHQLGKNNQNCDYADDVWSCKNAYMSRGLLDDEDVYYIYRVVGSKNCADITYCYNLEQCYECTYCFSGFNLKFSLDCKNCTDSWFLYDCRGCRNCFMCWNLRNKEYCILNKKYLREEYEEKLKSFKLNSRKALENLKREFKEHLKNDALHKSSFNVNTEHSEGNYLVNCKECRECYFLEEAEECLYVFRGLHNKSCIDVSGLLRGELCTNIVQSTDLYDCHAAIYCVDCNDSDYIDQCFNSRNLFGCVGLRRREYCILNKQYPREKYFELCERLIEKMKPEGEYGEFFPPKFAYNGFNVSLGSFYFNETEESIKTLGGFFEKVPDTAPGATSSIEIFGSELPDSSEQISNDFIGAPIKCTATGRTYNFIPQELDFYRRNNLPLPAYYPEYRNVVRFKQLLPIESHTTSCSVCKKEIVTYYPEPWGYENIACEKCYLEKVY